MAQTIEQRRASDKKRREEKPWRGLYATKRWKTLRAAQLKAHPFCKRCEENDKPMVPATVAHHKERHNGNPIKFFNSELASSCKQCHDVIEQGIEVRGYEAGHAKDGRPVDPDHPWNKGAAS